MYGRLDGLVGTNKTVDWEEFFKTMQNSIIIMLAADGSELLRRRLL